MHHQQLKCSKQASDEWNSIAVQALKCKLKVANKLNDNFFLFQAAAQILFSFFVFNKHLSEFENFTIR